MHKCIYINTYIYFTYITCIESSARSPHLDLRMRPAGMGDFTVEDDRERVVQVTKEPWRWVKVLAKHPV
jgi:hypothetical protein